METIDQRRKIEFKRGNEYNLQSDLPIEKGYFHMWLKKVYADKSEGAFAVIETELGEILELKSNFIKFIFPPGTNPESKL
jgi:hypothetical protein